MDRWKETYPQQDEAGAKSGPDVRNREEEEALNPPKSRSRDQQQHKSEELGETVGGKGKKG